MARVISELKPHWVLGENVAGFINMGLDKTVFDLESAGYAVQTYVYPACGVGAWHERTRTFIVGVDVSHAPCVRRQECKGRKEHQRVLVGQRDIPQGQPEWDKMEPSAVGGGVLPDADSLRRLPFDIEAGGISECEQQCGLGSSDNQAGKSNVGHGGAQSRLGGMANGVPAEMDGRKLWKREPIGISRITEETENRALHLKTLGNAVCPPQVYPILKCIADIETGACKNNCVFDEFC